MALNDSYLESLLEAPYRHAESVGEFESTLWRALLLRQKKTKSEPYVDLDAMYREALGNSHPTSAAKYWSERFPERTLHESEVQTWYRNWARSVMVAQSDLLRGIISPGWEYIEPPYIRKEVHKSVLHSKDLSELLKEIDGGGSYVFVDDEGEKCSTISIPQAIRDDRKFCEKLSEVLRTYPDVLEYFDLIRRQIHEHPDWGKVDLKTQRTYEKVREVVLDALFNL